MPKDSSTLVKGAAARWASVAKVRRRVQADDFFFYGGREVERSMSIGTVLLLCLPSSPIIRFFSISGGVSVKISMHSRCTS
jgi:hypothetical protein